MKEIRAWYVFYTYPRSEKKAYNTLVSSGYEVFLPLKQEIHCWKNRQKKLISEPIFPSYIFVWTYLNSIYNILQLPKIVRCVTCDSVPSTISSKEISLIKNLLESGNNFTLENDILLGKKAQIICGPFSGIKGILYERKGSNRFLIQISNIPFNLGVEIEVDCLRLLT